MDLKEAQEELGVSQGRFGSASGFLGGFQGVPWGVSVSGSLKSFKELHTPKNRFKVSAKVC